MSVGEERDNNSRSSSNQFVPRVGGSATAAGAIGIPEDSGEACEEDDDCSSGSTCFQGTCVGDGKLRFSLSWSADTDYDLHVITPDGTEIYYSNSVAAGGLLDVDDCVGASCRDPGGTHVENIFFPEAPPEGEYTYWAHNYAHDIAASFDLEVSKNGRVVESDGGTLPTREPGESTRYTFDY